MALLSDWKAAKKAFEDVAGKKRPGMNPSKAAKWFGAFKSETGLTPLCEKFDKLEVALKTNWAKLDLEQKKATLSGLDEALGEIKTKVKIYREKLSKMIDTDLKGETGQDDLDRALRNLDDEVQRILKKGKALIASYDAPLAVEKKGIKGGTLEAVKAGQLAGLKATAADLQRAALGMEVMVRNIKANPTKKTWCDIVHGSAASRDATTALKSVDMVYKDNRQLADLLPMDPGQILKALNIYGSGNQPDFWDKQFGTGDEKTAVMKHCNAMAKEIGGVKLLATQLKRVLAEMDNN